MILGELVGYVVATKQGPTFSRVHVYLIAGKTVYPGELLGAVPQNRPDVIVIGRVIEGRFLDRYQTPHAVHLHELMGTQSISADLDKLPGKFAMAEIEPLEEAKLHGENVALHEPKTLVPPGSPLYRLGNDGVATVLGLPRESDLGLRVGRTMDPSGAIVSLDPRKVLPRHILIVGSTGTGKTWLRGVLAEELHRRGIPQVHVDVHGEFIWATEDLKGENLIPGENLTVRLSSLSESDILALIPFLTELQAEIVRRAFLDLKAGVKAKSTTLGMYAEDAGRAEISKLLAHVQRAAQLMRARPETREMALARAAMLTEVKVIGAGIDWKKLLKEKTIINIDCRFLDVTALHAVVGAVARELLKMRMNNIGRPLALFVDEAHLFLPPLQDTPSGFVLRELIRYGRHYGLSLVLITPSPTDIDQRIVRMTNTRFIFAIEPDQLRYLRGVFADAPRDLIAKLPKFEVGTCLLTGSRETVRHAVPLRVESKRRTRHGGETPDFLV